ncbi:hypothetical protein GCM10011571_05450 [Marinithermofilum abyssi]|uniref:DUF1027 domain-containing protein n=1 Tax=Marinithermofilum abyssi TaxID=1571185 RepID=A0A8J2VG72_9BACL|nr:YutD family protein [Marinithermofilum abyssi]GGE07127.1 hypothetical protein GCM10011571_05450 [Marinithermofilum abyssi]
MKEIAVNGFRFEVVYDHKKGWNPEAFSKRYSEVLDKYDYIVGDWGYGQLRLKGFFADSHPRANRDTKIAHFEEYLHEYCNFGCAYFILRRIRDDANKGKSKLRERRANRG